VDWVGLAKTDGTLVLLMALERLGDVARTLIRHGRQGKLPGFRNRGRYHAHAAHNLLNA